MSNVWTPGGSMPDSTQTYYKYDENAQGPSAADEFEEEEMLLQKMNSQLMVGMQTLINMMIYMSQGGNFTRSDTTDRPGQFHS